MYAAGRGGSARPDPSEEEDTVHCSHPRFQTGPQAPRRLRDAVLAMKLGALLCLPALGGCLSGESGPPADDVASRSSELIASRSGTTAQGSSGSGTWATFSIARPPGVVNGDLCILGVAVNSASTSVSEAEGDSQWQAVSQATVGTSALKLWAFTHVVSAAAPSSFVFNLSAAARVAYTLSCYSGATIDAETVNASPGTRGNTAASTSITGAATVPTNDNTVVFALWAQPASATLTPTSGTAIGGTSRTTSGSADVSLGMAYAPTARGGSTVSLNATSNVAATSASIHFAVNSDTVPPAVGTLSASSPGWTAAGNVVLTLSSAADNVGLRHVEFWDAESNTLVATDPAPPWSLTWAFDKAQNGVHRFFARAVDTSGNSTDTPELVRTVDIAGTNEVVPVAADVIVRQLNPNTAYPADTYLYSDYCAQTNPCRTDTVYLRFTVPGRGPLTQATLKLYTSTNPSSGLHLLTQTSNTVWSETATTWNTKPALDGLTFAEVKPVATHSWVSVDVTDLVRSGEGFSFAVHSKSEDGWQFNSKESGSNPPQLLITYRGAVCGDGACNGSETPTSCAEDCLTAGCGDFICDTAAGETASSCAGDCAPSTCGDDLCSGTESCSSCAADCGACTACGNGSCENTESCAAGAAQCTADCGSCTACGASVATVCYRANYETCSTDVRSCCGDSVCSQVNNENYETCPQDCTAVCGDSVCSTAESCQSCSSDCVPTGGCPVSCGDGFCNGTEIPASCAADCG